MTDDVQQVTSTTPTHSNPVAKILVSGCLNGPPIRFNQTSVEVRSPIWTRWVSEGRLVPFCAELASGFQIPRPPAETVGGDGKAVLSGNATVLEDTGRDVTEQFTKGAELALSHALEQGCVAAVLTDGSPSCGSTYVYDGSFGGGTTQGTGVVAQLLIDNGIRVFSQDQLEEADLFIRQPSV
jgi:uncharacterized protein YbbK (DUF523 family)